MLETSAPGSHLPRGFLRIGGLTVARQQSSVALQLGCERIICIAPGVSAELIELQHQLEAEGVQFHLISHARALAGLISAVDEVILFADGLFVSAGQAAALLEEGQSVLVQPIEQGLAAGFERIDINHAFGGAMRLPGRLVERMADLPADCDVVSSLLRIALQAGVRQKPIPMPGQGGVFWTLVRSESEAHALEPQWIRQRTRGEGLLSISSGIALLAVRSFGPALLHAGSGAGVLVVAALILALLAIGAGWFGLAALGLGFVALGWIMRESAVMLSRIETDLLSRRKEPDSNELYGWLLDAVIILLSAWGTTSAAGQVIAGLFSPFMLVALLRILPRLIPQRWSPLFADRGLLALMLAAAMLAGVASPAIHLAASLAALAGVIVPFGQMRLTRR